MRKRAFILLSPGPVDGYPPVQYQARLLAEAGHPVEVVTSPLSAARPVPNFSCPGVRVSCIPASRAFAGRLARNIAYVLALLAARRRAGPDAVEICFDPIGMLLSDYTPYRPVRRVAHFHELLQYPDSFLEKRLQRAITGFQMVVVPDEERARHTAAVLGLAELPLVIENYPLRAERRLPRRPSGREFEVVYCGALGFNQKLDVMIRSSLCWPEGARLVLIGNVEAAVARELMSFAASLGAEERVEFLGWMDTEVAEARMAQSDLAVGLLNPDLEQLRTALGASNKRFQYMKAALPQIGDQNPGVPELVEGNGVGTCVHRHDPAEIAEVVSAYMADRSRCLSEGEKAFSLHQQKFNYEAVFGRLIDRIGAW